MFSQLSNDLLEVLDQLAGGIHSGFRPAHARGQMYSGTFTSTPDAVALTRATHAARASTAVTVRFSASAGVPTVPENAAQGSSPQGMAIRFHLDEHIHTDIVAHSFNGFATRTGEEFLEFLKAVAASGPDSPTPPPISAFLATHPAAKAFAEAPKPVPKSFASQPYFAITAFKFTNVDGETQFGRFQIVPDVPTEVLSADEAAKMPADFLSTEMLQRLAKGPVTFQILVQLAEPGDDVTDSTKVWPDSRKKLTFGTLTINQREDEQAPERRKIIFDPVPRIDGIDSAGDPLTDVRAEIYLLSGRRRRANGTL